VSRHIDDVIKKVVDENNVPKPISKQASKFGLVGRLVAPKEKQNGEDDPEAGQGSSS